MRVCMRACVRACVRPCVRACVCVCRLKIIELVIAKNMELKEIELELNKKSPS